MNVSFGRSVNSINACKNGALNSKYSNFSAVRPGIYCVKFTYRVYVEGTMVGPAVEDVLGKVDGSPVG